MSTRPTKSTAGFTIAELLIALAVMGILLAAVAVAFNASFTNYRENEDIFKSINKARQALYRMTSQIRTGDNFNPEDPNNRCSFFTADNEDITYEYRNADKKLYLITNNNGNEYVLCNNVTSMSFIKNPTGDGDVKSVQISMTVASGDTQRTISAAAVIRKNLEW
jgi:prepilin-type N-terminal cleavage/methylation domain-containing protein